MQALKSRLLCCVEYRVILYCKISKVKSIYPITHRQIALVSWCLIYVLPSFLQCGIQYWVSLGPFYSGTWLYSQEILNSLPWWVRCLVFWTATKDLLALTEVMSMQKVKVIAQRSRSKKSKQILSHFGHFRTQTPVWIHRWLQNNLQSLKWYRRYALLFFKVIQKISKSHGKNGWF